MIFSHQICSENCPPLEEFPTLISTSLGQKPVSSFPASLAAEAKGHDPGFTIQVHLDEPVIEKREEWKSFGLGDT